MALELAILTPVAILMVLMVVALGRVTQGRQLVDEAAAVGGRAAALAATPAQAGQDARQAVADTLAQAGVSCQGAQVDVDTRDFVPGGEVVVGVRCTSQMPGMSLSGLPGNRTLAATSHTPIDTYRDLGDGAQP